MEIIGCMNGLICSQPPWRNGTIQQFPRYRQSWRQEGRSERQ
jgi:hypothetical protein